MKNRLVKNYIFDASAKTVTCSEFTDLERIVTIINQTDGVVIYNPINVATGGTLSNSVLTLTYDTTSMSDTDTLVIYVDHPSSNFKLSFAKVVASGVDTNKGTVIKTGTGMGISQSAGNLVVTTGTTAYSESIIRSNKSFDPNGIVRWGLTLSQRIANNNFIVEFVDVVGDGLSMTINSTTSVTVTKAAHGFTTSDIGKGIWIGNISVASCLPQRAVIASIPTVDTITFTVTGFPASGSGTCSLFGYNYHQVVYNGTTATALGGGYNTQREGWQIAHGSTTISTTASGHISTITSQTRGTSQYADETLVTGTGNQSTGRLSAKQNIPEGVPLYLQIRTFNGSTAPASTTTMTVSFIDAVMYDPQIVMLGGLTHISPTNSLPVSQQGTVTVSGSVTATVATTTLALPTIITDITSAAITTTTTTAAVSPSSGSSYKVVIPVTAVSGTTPTLSVRIEESDDSGTNWYARYTFNTITATGIYRSPILRLNGNRIRYVQTITGTTPSFTRAINRLQRQDNIYSGYPGKIISAASTNATSVLSAPCELTKLSATNTNASARYLKIYDKSSAPTVGTDTPVAVYMLPGATTGGGSNVSLTLPDSFLFGFALAITTGAADSDTGAVAANEIIVNYSIG